MKQIGIGKQTKSQSQHFFCEKILCEKIYQYK